jgi:putative transposase
VAAIEHHGARFCIEALNEALADYGRPEIFNTDQGSQFTSLEFTGVLKGAQIAISMDGRGRCRCPPPAGD